jgi:hypothetical protein
MVAEAARALSASSARQDAHTQKLRSWRPREPVRTVCGHHDALAHVVNVVDTRNLDWVPPADDDEAI